MIMFMFMFMFMWMWMWMCMCRTWMSMHAARVSTCKQAHLLRCHCIPEHMHMVHAEAVTFIMGG